MTLDPELQDLRRALDALDDEHFATAKKAISLVLRALTAPVGHVDAAFSLAPPSSQRVIDRGGCDERRVGISQSVGARSRR